MLVFIVCDTMEVRRATSRHISCVAVILFGFGFEFILFLLKSNFNCKTLYYRYLKTNDTCCPVLLTQLRHLTRKLKIIHKIRID